MVMKIDRLIVAHGQPVGLDHFFDGLMTEEADVKPSSTVKECFSGQDILIHLLKPFGCHIFFCHIPLFSRHKDRHYFRNFQIFGSASSFCLILGVILFDFCPVGALGKGHHNQYATNSSHVSARIRTRTKLLLNNKKKQADVY